MLLQTTSRAHWRSAIWLTALAFGTEAALAPVTVVLPWSRSWLQAKRTAAQSAGMTYRTTFIGHLRSSLDATAVPRGSTTLSVNPSRRTRGRRGLEVLAARLELPAPITTARRVRCHHRAAKRALGA